MAKTKRLLPIVKPTHYTLSLAPDLEKFIFSGEEIFTFNLLKTTNTIELHAHELTIQKAILVEEDKRVEAKISYNNEEKTVLFTFPNIVTPGEKVLEISYTGLLGEKMKGFYRSTYEVNGQTRFMATTQFEEIGARQAFVGVDEPQAKAIFAINLIIPRHLTAISNTIPKKTTEKDNLKYVEFIPTPQMSTYNLAFIVGEFESIEQKSSHDVLVRVFATPGKKKQLAFALDTAVKMLSFYEEYFDIAYPLPVLDLIAIPDFDAGAMENWGAITFREVALFVDEEKTPTAAKQWVAVVIAHELAHMWFGNLVTMEWWTYLWLNEGFASFIEYLATDKLFPEWDMWEQFAVLDHNRALGLDSLENTHPVETPVEDIEKLKENFDEISYSKGASIIYMLATYLGEKDFRDGLRYYLKKHAYANASTEDLWGALEKISGKPVKKMMDTYTKKSGHPIISITEKEDGLSLTQQRFFINKTKTSIKENIVWEIPLLTVSSQKSLQGQYVMQEKTLTLPKPSLSHWVKLNSGETTLARVLYTSSLYENLERAILDKAISSVDRMGILRDLFDGAEGGYITTAQALNFVRAYRNEDSYVVWASLSGKLAKVENILSETPLIQSYRDFVRPIFSDITQKLGWEKRSEDSHSDALLRNIVLYAHGHYGDEPTIKKAQDLFTDFIKKGKVIDTDIRGVVYMLVAENGGKEEFEILKKLYIEEEFHQEKNRISNALSSFKQPDLIEGALEFSLSKYVRLQDLGRFTLLGFENPDGRLITWDFIQKNWEYLYEKHLGQHGMTWLIEGAGSSVSLKLKKEIEHFFKKHPAPQMVRTIQQVLEQITTHVNWLERDEEAIEAFLQGFTNKP